MPSESTIPAGLMAPLLGIEDPEQARLVRKLVAGLEEVAPGLVPQVSDHPYLAEITQGRAALAGFVDRLQGTNDPELLLPMLDAVARILEFEDGTPELHTVLRSVMGAAKDAKVVALAARGLALGRDRGFLEHRMQFLAGDDPAEIATSATLLGLARWKAAVKPLLLQLRPDNIVCAEEIIWALGELRNPDAVPKLHAMLRSYTYAQEVCDALAKIGAIESMAEIAPVLLEALPSQREHAAMAMASIIGQYDGDLEDPELKEQYRDMLERVIDKDPSYVVRFFSLLGYMQLGGKLSDTRLVELLGGALEADEMSAIAKVFKSAAAHRTGKN